MEVWALALLRVWGMESGEENRGGDEVRRKLERLERELGVYRRLYRGALEMMKAARRREAAKRPLPPAP